MIRSLFQRCNTRTHNRTVEDRVWIGILSMPLNHVPDDRVEAVSMRVYGDGFFRMCLPALDCDCHGFFIGIVGADGCGFLCGGDHDVYSDSIHYFTPLSRLTYSSISSASSLVSASQNLTPSLNMQYLHWVTKVHSVIPTPSRIFPSHLAVVAFCGCCVWVFRHSWQITDHYAGKILSEIVL